MLPLNNGLGGGVNITENNIRILIIPTIKEDTIKIDKELSETRLLTPLKPRFRTAPKMQRKEKG